ncbi:MAG TPA: CorA family divalent cation transporter [Azospirillum sp.]|nr:CorA family divalent cation transporter [Azospirillum sp.]
MDDTKPVATAPEYGVEPGLRFACRLDGNGGSTNLDWSGVTRWQGGDGVLWIHLEREDPATAQWLRCSAGIDPVIADALLAEESRPRVEGIEDGLLIVLRGICVVIPGHETEISHENNLVPLHLWAEGDRIISVRDKNLFLTALRDIRQSLERGKGPRQSGELLVQIADKVVRDLEPLLDDMDEEVDRLEEKLFDANDREVRQHLIRSADDHFQCPPTVKPGRSMPKALIERVIRTKPSGAVRISRLRRRAVHLRRYLAPQREALNRLDHEDPDWLTERDKVRLREVTDKVVRFVEYLDAIRDRASILHDDLSALISERIARNSHRLAALAALLLPPSLIAGVFGMNVGGVPGSTLPWAFVGVCGFLAVLSLGVLWILYRIGWL